MGEPEAAELDRGRLFQAQLAEHIQARQEMTSAINNQHLVLSFGSAAIFGVFVAGFLVWEQQADFAVFFAIPLISVWVLGMWLAEVVRMLRAVQFCRTQEKVINRTVGCGDEPALRWEAWRAEEPGRTITWSYLSVVVVLALCYVAGLTLGLIVAPWERLVKFGVAGGAVVLVLGPLLVWVGLLFIEWSEDPERAGSPSWLTQFARWLGR